MSDYTSQNEEEAEIEARFYPPPGETEENGWEFDGLDWVQYDSEETPWVFDGEEWAVKDPDGNIYVQREGNLCLKDGADVYLQNELGEWIPLEEAYFEEEQTRPGGLTYQTRAQPSPMQLTAQFLLDNKAIRFLSLADVFVPTAGASNVLPHGGSIFRGNAPTPLEYYRTLAGTGAAMGDTIRQLHFMCRSLLRLAPTGKSTAGDQLVYGIAASVLDLFDSSRADIGVEFGLVKSAMASLLSDPEGHEVFKDLEVPMRKRAVSLLRYRLDTLATQTAIAAASDPLPTGTDKILYRLSLALRALLHSVSKSLAALDDVA